MVYYRDNCVHTREDVLYLWPCMQFGISIKHSAEICTLAGSHNNRAADTRRPRDTNKHVHCEQSSANVRRKSGKYATRTDGRTNERRHEHTRRRRSGTYHYINGTDWLGGASSHAKLDASSSGSSKSLVVLRITAKPWRVCVAHVYRPVHSTT